MYVVLYIDKTACYCTCMKYCTQIKQFVIVHVCSIVHRYNSLLLYMYVVLYIDTTVCYCTCMQYCTQIQQFVIVHVCCIVHRYNSLLLYMYVVLYIDKTVCYCTCMLYCTQIKQEQTNIGLLCIPFSYDIKLICIEPNRKKMFQVKTEMWF